MLHNDGHEHLGGIITSHDSYTVPATQGRDITNDHDHEPTVMVSTVVSSAESIGSDGNTSTHADDDVAVTIPGIDEPPSLHTLVAAAASEPAQDSDWWLPILGFESEVVQNCYDARQGDTQLLGCWVAWALTALAFIQRVSQPRLHVSGWVLLLTMCMAGLGVTILPIVLCIINDDSFNKRHVLRKIAQGTAFMAVVGTVASNLTRLEGSVHASSVTSWEETILLGCPLVILPLYVSLLLRVSFPWAAMVCMSFSIGFLVIIFSAATEPLSLMISVLFYASATISILYGTEASAQQRFMEQLQHTKVQRDLELSKARVVQMELAAVLHRTQADLASAQAQIAQTARRGEVGGECHTHPS
jgi:hypothetical protein